VPTPVAPTVSVVIPAYNKWEYTFRCLMALAHHTRDVAHEVIVIDNASSDETAQALPQLEKIRFQRNPSNLGFARACNQGAALARGRYLVFLNNDTEPRAGWLSAMVRVVEARPEVAVVGNLLLFPDGTIQHAGVIFGYGVPFPITPFHAHYRQPAEAGRAPAELRAVTAACMLIRAQVFATVGGFDEGYVNGYEDVDLCFKVGRTGAKIVYTPDSVVVHHESVSEGRFASDGANIDRLNERWLGHLGAGGFEVDVRDEIPPATVAPHTATSIVVPVRDALLTLVPSVESLLRTTAAHDEILLIDDGATGASARIAADFAARHPQRVRLIAHSPATGFPAAVARGLEEARHARVVVMAPHLRVVGDWLARLQGHLLVGAGLGIGAISPSLLPVQRLRLKELLYPVGATAGDPAPARAVPGQLEKATLVTAPLIYGDRDRLREISGRAPAAFFGGDAGALAGELAADGWHLGCAGDVGVYRLAQLASDADPRLAARYLAQQSDNLGYERRYQQEGRAPVGILTRAQTELASVILVADRSLASACAALEAIYRGSQRPLEVVVVDCLGDDRLAAALPALAGERARPIHLRAGADTGVAQAFNLGLAAARGEYLALLRDDLLVAPGWLARLLALMAIDPAIALTGPAIGGGGDGAQDAGMRAYRHSDELPRFAESWALAHQGEHAIVSPLSGAGLVLRRQVVSRLGGLDPRFSDGTHADHDYCVRAARAGFRMAIAFDALVHRIPDQGGGAGPGPRRSDAERAFCAEVAWQRFCDKWGHPLEARAPSALRSLGGKPFDRARDHVVLPHLDLVWNPLALPAGRPLAAVGRGSP
jgi:GT2 family glycosyltransferase